MGVVGMGGRGVHSKSPKEESSTPVVNIQLVY